MRYRLDELAALAAELGFETRRVESDRLDVLIEDVVLVFCNLSKDADSPSWFRGHALALARRRAVPGGREYVASVR
jgi:hypothetical protein